MSRISLKDRMKCECITTSVRVTDVENNTREQLIRWFGRVRERA